MTKRELGSARSRHYFSPTNNRDRINAWRDVRASMVNHEEIGKLGIAVRRRVITRVPSISCLTPAATANIARIPMTCRGDQRGSDDGSRDEQTSYPSDWHRIRCGEYLLSTGSARSWARCFGGIDWPFVTALLIQTRILTRIFTLFGSWKRPTNHLSLTGADSQSSHCSILGARGKQYRGGGRRGCARPVS